MLSDIIKIMHINFLIHIKISLFLIVNLSFTLMIPVPSHAQNKEIAGWIEGVRIHPGNLYLNAKLDTGAKTSSLNAPGMKLFKQKGEQWVRFEIQNKKGKKILIEQKVERIVKIKRKLMFSQSRPVIRLGICMGNTYKEVEVSLIDRSHFNYQMLIGRNFLVDDFLVDPSLTFSKKPVCNNLKSQ